MRKRRKILEQIADNNINPSTVKDIRTRSLFIGEITRTLSKKLRDSDKYELAKELLDRVTVLQDRDCWIIAEDWSQYSKFKGHIAHRLSYILFVSDIIDSNIICHRCDRKGCINYNHLFQGTNKDNRDDFIIKYNEYMLGRKFGNVKEVIPWNLIKPVLNRKPRARSYNIETVGSLRERLDKITKSQYNDIK